MNVRLLRRVVKHILAEPKRLDMDRYASDSTRSPCGTVGCIAGWATILARPKLLKTRDWFHVHHRTGQDVLQLSLCEVDRLFFFSGWPENFAREYTAAKTAKRRAKIAAARIEHFIQTEGRE